MRALLLLIAVAASACGATMSNYYSGVATAAVTVSTGTNLLEQHDKQQQAAIVARAKAGDATGAETALKAYLVNYAAARKALAICSDLVIAAQAAGPSVELAINRKTQIREWIAKLASAALNITAALSPMGVQIK